MQRLTPRFLNHAQFHALGVESNNNNHKNDPLFGLKWKCQPDRQDQQTYQGIRQLDLPIFEICRIALSVLLSIIVGVLDKLFWPT